MSRRTHHLDVDLLGGLQQLQVTEGRVGVWLPAISEDAADSRGGAALRDLLRREAEGYHQLEAEVARRRQAFFAERTRSDDGGPGQAWYLDAARAAGGEADAHVEALRSLEQRLDDVLARCVVLAPGAEARELDVNVQLHDDGYALEASREAALRARRAYLGLPAEDDWSSPTNG